MMVPGILVMLIASTNYMDDEAYKRDTSYHKIHN